jgi:hypothetical protein
MVRSFVSRRLRSRRTHVHIDKDDGNKRLRFDDKRRVDPAQATPQTVGISPSLSPDSRVSAPAGLNNRAKPEAYKKDK